MKKPRQRNLIRFIHLIASAAVILYIYSPLAEALWFGQLVQWAIVPVVTLSGFWMWTRSRFTKWAGRKTSPGSTSKDKAGVLAPPPLIVCLWIVLGLGLQLWFPWQLAGLRQIYVLGYLLIGINLLMVAHSFKQFLQAKTPINPEAATLQLVTSGLYKISRNPMYTPLILLQAGLGIILFNPWILLLIIPAIWIVQQFVILPEEHYLERKFGEQYLVYRKRVRRWL